MKHAHIYNELVRFYNRSRRKLQSLAVEGKNLRKQNILQRRIVRLFKTLTRLQQELKLGTATAALSTGILLFQPNPVQAQIISFGDISNNPFGAAVDLNNNSIPAFADLDGDGDMDLLSWRIGAFGNTDGFSYFQNTGTAADPVYGAITSLPGLGGIDYSYECAPAFADLDGDGDMDMMTDNDGVDFLFFQNTGSSSTPVFAAPQTNPFGLSNDGNLGSAAFADLDGDGDMDLMARGAAGLYYFQNTGTAAAPAFDAPQTNPFGLPDDNSYGFPAFADLDGDADMDLIARGVEGFYYFQNTGTATAPAFATPQANPFGLTNSGSFTPAFADLDADGDLDMMIGSGSGTLSYYQNTGTAADPFFHAIDPQINPFGLGPIANLLTPAFADLDGDGDMDMMAGGKFGYFAYYQYTGTAGAPAFAGVITDPFGLAYSYYDTAPSFADLDADGDIDMILGNSADNFQYYQNTGSAAAPAFDAPQTNPFGLMDIGRYATPAFADLDGDGDMDLLTGERNGSFFYFQNAGTAAAPAFIAPLTDPYGLMGIGRYSTPAFADLDDDGDMDLLAGQYLYANNYSSLFYYFENTTPVISSCPVPSNLSATNLTSSSSKLNWDAVAGAEGYKIRYKVSGTDPWILKNSNGNSKNLHNLSPNTNYTWEVKTFCTINPGSSSDWSAKQHFTTGPLRIGDESVQQTSFQIYPNPAGDHATIQFSVGVPSDTLSQSSHVYIKVFDVSGKEIETLLDAEVEQGEHSLPINTNHFSKGVYMVRLISDLGIRNQKLIVQ